MELEPHKKPPATDFRYIHPAKRRATQYEEVTLHTQWDPKNFAKQGWFSPSSDGRTMWSDDSTRLRATDWWGYRDPAQQWFRPYVETQAKQEEAIDLAVEGAKRNGLCYGCKHGGCGSCKALIVDGEVDQSEASSFALLDFEREQGYALLCSAYPLSDVVIGEVELMIKLMPGGLFSSYVAERLTAGERLTLQGPYGNFSLRDSGRPALFIAGGSGMAPILALQLVCQRVAGERCDSGREWLCSQRRVISEPRAHLAMEPCVQIMGRRPG